MTEGSYPENWHWSGESSLPGRTVVFDMDGVLSNADNRQHFLEGPSKDWKGFFNACGNDTTIEETIRLLGLIAQDVVVILLTARPLRVQSETLDWLSRNNLRWNLLIMRKQSDYGASLVFKQQTVRTLKLMGFDLLLAFEDDARNQAMFKAEGVPCMYVHSGYYSDRDHEQG